MAKTKTIGRSILRRARALVPLLAVMFVAVQLAALVHEYEHVFHHHEGPCAQHFMADNLAKAPAPPLLLMVASASVSENISPSLLVLLSRTVPSAVARGPPRLLAIV
ncbi:MAG: hypothetical protein HY308_06035 [Gammaproteobacteria bacterium]|nr:hypothetical protein [Gammaproteobacteria bacterium]